MSWTHHGLTDGQAVESGDEPLPITAPSDNGHWRLPLGVRAKRGAERFPRKLFRVRSPKIDRIGALFLKQKWTRIWIGCRPAAVAAAKIMGRNTTDVDQRGKPRAKVTIQHRKRSLRPYRRLLPYRASDGRRLY